MRGYRLHGELPHDASDVPSYRMRTFWWAKYRTVQKHSFRKWNDALSYCQRAPVRGGQQSINTCVPKTTEAMHSTSATYNIVSMQLQGNLTERYRTLSRILNMRAAAIRSTMKRHPWNPMRQRVIRLNACQITQQWPSKKLASHTQHPSILVKQIVISDQPLPSCKKYL